MLRKKQQPYIPTPIGAWPLSKTSLIEETTTDMLVNKMDIGIDPLWTPAGFFGSPLLSLWKDGLFGSSMLVEYKPPRPSWPGITIACWLRFENFSPTPKKYYIMVSRSDDDNMEFYIF